MFVFPRGKKNHIALVGDSRHAPRSPRSPRSPIPAATVPAATFLRASVHPTKEITVNGTQPKTRVAVTIITRLKIDKVTLGQLSAWNELKTEVRARCNSSRVCRRVSSVILISQIRRKTHGADQRLKREEAEGNGIGKNRVDVAEGRVTIAKRSINAGTSVLKPPLALCNKPGVPPVLINAQRLC